MWSVLREHVYSNSRAGKRVGDIPIQCRIRDAQQASWEHVKCVQDMLNALWPAMKGFLERNVLRETLEPELAKAGVRFHRVYLGDTPPQLYGVKTVVCHGKDGDLAQEVQIVVDLGFHPGSSMDISLALGPLRASVSDLSVQGRLCVCLVGLVPRKPVVSGIKLFFENPPEMSFSLSGIAAALPITPQKIQEYIKDAICASMVLPKSVDIHVDSFMRAFAEPDFLDYHDLHTVMPLGMLRTSVVSLDVERLRKQSARVYAKFSVGGKRETTQSRTIRDVPCRLAWPEERVEFIVDSLVDQDLCLELWAEDNSNLMIQCDDLLMQARISVVELVSAFEGRHGAVRLRMNSHGGRHQQHEAGAAILTGAFLPLLPTKPPSWQDVQALIQITVDCVTGLGPEMNGKTCSVRALLLSEGQVPIELAKTGVCTAGRAQVAEARVLHTAFEESRWAEAKSRIRLLCRRGAKLSPEEMAFVLSGIVTQDQAEKLMREVESEGVQNEGPDAAVAVEVLFEEQLRALVGDPRKHGLRIQFWDENKQAEAGVIEWSSLAYLANISALEDNLQAYALDGPCATHGGARIYLKRALRVLGPGLKARGTARSKSPR